MKNALNISADLALPLDVAGEALAIVATRGAGKSFCSAVLIEELYCNQVQVVVIDCTGVYWGLRSTAKGLPDGLPIIVLGGAHGDVPLEETAGKLIADLIVDAGQSLVLDLSDFDSKGAQIRFMTDFAERLYRRKARTRTTLHLVVDEADEFAPQVPQKREARLLGAMETLVRRGRSRGIGLTLITQRSASIAKSVLDLVDTMVVMRMGGPRDHKAIEGWIKHQSAEDRAGVLQSLPGLPTGTAWVWSPVRKILQKVAIRRIDTFDSYVTPKPGAARVDPKGLATVDIAQLGEQIKATAERAKADDPAALRAEIRALKASLASASQDPAIDRQAIVDAHARGVIDGHGAGYVAGYNSMLETMLTRVSAVEVYAEGIRALIPMVADEAQKLPATRPVVKHPVQFAKLSKSTVSASSDVGGLGKAERKILTALVQCGGSASKKKVALMAVYAMKGGGFNNALGALRSKGLIDNGEPVRITTAGIGAVPDAAPLPSGDELVDYWRGQLPKAESAILGYLSQSGGTAPKETLASQTNYEPTGGGFNNALGRLRTLGLINRGDPIALAPEIFE